MVSSDLEALFAASAPLQGYDLLNDPPQTERVDILVPVPESHFDPNLLVIETPDPAFRAEAERIFALRQDWRQRRDYVRGRFEDLSVIIRGGTKRKLVLNVKDTDQIENEPTETLESFPLACEIVPPTDKVTGWQYKISFSEKPQLKTLASLTASMHVDEEHLPVSIQYQWQLSNGTFIENRFIDLPPIEVVDNLIEPGVEPIAVNLHRLFKLELDETVLSGIDANQLLIGVTLTVDGGRSSIAYIQTTTRSDNTVVRLWTPIRQSTEKVTVDGGVTVAGPRLLAPFESLYKPEPVNGIDFQVLLNSFSPILTELSANLRAANQQLTGKYKLVMNDVGLQNLIKIMIAEADNAENVVSQCYGKVQANMQLLQSVLVGESDAEQALSSPSAGAMSAIRGRAVEKTQVRESMTIDPNWTGIKNLQNAKQKPQYNFKELNLDDTVELRPRLMSFTKRFAYSPAYQAYQAMGAAMVDAIQSVAKLNIGYSDEFVPELRKNYSGRGVSSTQLTVKSSGQIGLTIDSNRSQFAKGTWIKIICNTQDDKFMEGVITEYAPKTGIAVVECEYCAGDQNSESAWNIIILGKSVRFNELATMNRNEILNLKFSDIDEINLDKGPSSGEIVAKGIRRADLIILVLRKVENYLTKRREQIKNAQLALAAARFQVRSASTRMATVNGKLAEVRHDLAVARTLWQEEIARVDSINDRRDEVIAKHVKLLAYVRPRTVNLIQYQLPSCEFERTDALAPVPAALQSNIDPPDELENYIQLFRHAPVRWFTSLSAKIKEVNSRERMQRLLEAAQQNAGRLTSAYLKTIDQSSASARVYSSGYTQIEQLRRNVLKCIVAQRGRTWEELFALVIEHAALSDIMDGAHGQNSLSREAALELESFGKVAASLHAEFSSVMPGIRMLWVERYSQFDRPAPLRDITTLPKVEQLSRISRKRFQAFLNWMFGRIDAKESGAVSLVNDLVRMCLLLASHAPVNRLVLGHVPHPIAVRPGLLVPVKVADAGSVKVGMQFQVWSNNSIVARGFVENLRSEDVSVRVEQTHNQLKTIETNMKIQFMPAGVMR